MKLGDFEIPEIRLFPTTVDTLEQIYKVKKREKIQSKDLAIFLGFKYGTEPHYYRKIRALTVFGLIDGKGIFQISELGEKLLHPRDTDEKKLVITKAVLNVPLWNEIYQKHGKKPREDNFWAVLMDITKIDPDTAKSYATKVLGWYMADITHVSDSFVSHGETASITQPLRSSSTEDQPMSQQQIQETVLENKEKIPFGKSYIVLPKDDLKKEWGKFQKFMKIYLDDYKEETEDESDTNISKTQTDSDDKTIDDEKV